MAILQLLNRIFCSLLALIFTSLSILFEFPSKTPPNLDCLEFGLLPPQDVVYTIERSRMTDGEMIMVTSLQGITAQTRAKIYIRDGERSAYLEDYLAQHPELTETAFTDAWALAEACKDALSDAGFVLFTPGDNPSANMAATVAGVEKWLMVAREDAVKAQAIGLVQQASYADASLESKAQEDPQKALFDAYKDRLNNSFLLHQFFFLATTRDYAIATKSPTIFAKEDDARGLAFRKEVFAWMQPNSPVYGWTTGEGAFVSDASESGLFVVAADHAINLSFLAAIGQGDTISQKNHPAKRTADPGKHYVALVLSDGDNLQWYCSVPVAANSHYNKRLADNTSFKMSWTAPPLAARSAPAVLEKVYGMASENDTFVCGVSGAGYINPARYPKHHLKNFAALTDVVMEQTDMSIVCLLDSMSLFDSPQLTMWELSRAYSYFAKQPHIKGGLLQIGDRYQQLGGRIIWSEGKPFISSRLSFWHPDGDDKMTDAWVEQFAAQVNALQADNTSENGYTYLNIHPWSASYEHVALLASLLDEHIELVTAEELVQLAADNVIH